jgi:hypothetical protein
MEAKSVSPFGAVTSLGVGAGTHAALSDISISSIRLNVMNI